MRVRPPRLTVQQLVGLIAVAALVLAGPLEFIRYKLQERALICRRVVEESEALLPGIEARVSSLETRIARFTQQSPSDPRHKRWVNDLATYRGMAMRVRTDIDVFQRVTLRPWEPIPTNSAFGVLELGEDDKKTIDRDFAGWTTLALAFAIGAALLAGTLMTRRLKRER